MPDLNLPTRKPLRMQGYDYATATAYFVTVCVDLRSKIFGSVVDGKLRLSPLGQMIHDTWQGLPKYYAGLQLDEFVVMPNHFHAVIGLENVVGAGVPAGPPENNKIAGPPTQNEKMTGLHRDKTTDLSITTVMRRFKSFTTNAYHKGSREGHWHEFSKNLWQRGYHDHIVRNDIELAKIRMYIQDNPTRWDEDEENLGFNKILCGPRPFWPARPARTINL